MVELSEKLKLDLNKIVDAVNHGYQEMIYPNHHLGWGTIFNKDPYFKFNFQET